VRADLAARGDRGPRPAQPGEALGLARLDERATQLPRAGHDAAHPDRDAPATERDRGALGSLQEPAVHRRLVGRAGRHGDRARLPVGGERGAGERGDDVLERVERVGRLVVAVAPRRGHRDERRRARRGRPRGPARSRAAPHPAPCRPACGGCRSGGRARGRRPGWARRARGRSRASSRGRRTSPSARGRRASSAAAAPRPAARRPGGSSPGAAAAGPRLSAKGKVCASTGIVSTNAAAAPPSQPVSGSSVPAWLTLTPSGAWRPRPLPPRRRGPGAAGPSA